MQQNLVWLPQGAQDVQAHRSPKWGNLQGKALRGCLSDIMSKYSSLEMLKRIAPLSSLQMNESINSVMGTKLLKIGYYGGSESNDVCVAAGMAQANEGTYSSHSPLFFKNKNR